MEVTYIHHSCSLVETRLCYYLFDYEKGSLPRLNAEKPVIVFASHSHHDHYNPKVFTILKEMGMQKIQPVLSEDITPSGDPEQFCNTASAFAAPLRVAPNKEYILCLGQKLTTYRSTDLGVAFLIEDGEELFYHAGDLNDWLWEGEEPSYNEQMTRDYRRQIDALARKLNGRKLDCAFVVLDPRQEKDYDRGMLYFLNQVNADKVYPMHYWEKPQVIRQFLQEHPKYKDRIQATE